MQYNQEKKQAYEYIRKALQAGKPIDRNALHLLAMENFGMGQLVVDRYLNTLLEGGYIKIDKNSIKWIPTKK